MEEDKQRKYFLIDTKNTFKEKEKEILSRSRTYKVVKPRMKFSGYIMFYGFKRYSEFLNELVKELKTILLFFNEGMYGLGNSKSRGYGQIKVLEAKLIIK